MADLTWTDVVIIGLVAMAGFTFLSFWWSGIMERRGWSWQVKSKPKRRQLAGQAATTTTAMQRPPKVKKEKAPRKEKPAKADKPRRVKPANAEKPAKE